MAKKMSDSFFIRKSLLTDNTGSFVQTEIDLGSYVDALGMAVLRIHNIAVAWTDSSGNAAQVLASSDSAADRSVVSSGIVDAQNSFGSDEFPLVSHDMDNLPQLWTNGYLIATETLYLGGEASSGWVAAEDLTCSIIMECTVEKMSKEAALALALSQQ